MSEPVARHPDSGRGSRNAVAHLVFPDGLAMRALFVRVKAFAQTLSPRGGEVLDFGSGDAPYRELFVHAGTRYFTSDIDGNPDVLITPGSPLPVDSARFDAVVSFQVLEHVRDVANYLREARRVLKPDGRLFLSTHGVWPYHPHPTDFWRWTRDGLAVTLEASGFEVESMTPLCGPGIWMSMFPLLVLRRVLGPLAFLAAPLNLTVNLLARLVDACTPSGVRRDNSSIYVAVCRPR